MFRCLKSSGSRIILRLSMEATPLQHGPCTRIPRQPCHKPNFSHHPGAWPAGCVTELLRRLYRKSPPSHLEPSSGPRPPPPGPASLQSTQSRVLHAAAGRDLASITEPGHLRPGETGDTRCSDDSSFAVGHTLALLAFLKAPHVCRERRCGGHGSTQSQRLPSREKKGNEKRLPLLEFLPSHQACPTMPFPGYKHSRRASVWASTFVHDALCHRA